MHTQLMWATTVSSTDKHTRTVPDPVWSGLGVQNIPHWSSNGSRSSIDPALKITAPYFLSDLSVNIIDHNSIGLWWHTACHASAPSSRQWWCSPGATLPSSVGPSGPPGDFSWRAHLHALLATEDVPVAMEPHARCRYRVNSTIRAGKWRLNTETQGLAQPCLRRRYEEWQFWFQVPFWEHRRSRKLEVIVCLL